jgi:hypothetical protein
VTLGEGSQVVGLHVEDGSLVNFSGWDKFLRDEFSEPRGSVLVVFVVVVHEGVGVLPQKASSSKSVFTP